jgi:uncharacterized protein
MSILTPRERFDDLVAELGGSDTPVVEMGIPVRDGIELAADVYLPASAERPAPAIVQSTPYDKSNQSWFVPEARFFQANGYAYVIHDSRGRGKSEGDWLAFVNDGPDGHDVIEWVAAQDWCTGRVGTTGISYDGWTQWAIANERPAHLTCMVSTAAAGRFMEEIPYSFGIFQLYFVWWLRGVRRRIMQPYGGGVLEEIDWEEVFRRLPVGSLEDFIQPTGSSWKDWMEHDALDDYWRAIRFDNEGYAAMNAPCLHVNGWFDIEDLQGGLHHYTGMMEKSTVADQQYLIVGPWSHVNTRFPHRSYGGLDFGDDAAIEMEEIHLRWFDHWLRQQDNGMHAEPRARLFETGTNRWLEGSRYPRPTTEACLFLRSDGEDGTLSSRPPDDDPARSFVYDPNDPVPTLMDVRKYPLEDYPLDQTPLEARPDVLCYTSAALEEEISISGWPRMQLHASSHADDTDWHVKLTDVFPDGRSMRVASGCLRGACWESLSEPKPLVPGTVYRFPIELNPVQHAFVPGHRIRVTVTSSDFPWFARSMNRFGPIATVADPRPARNTVVHSSEHPSCIRLPLERGSTDSL